MQLPTTRSSSVLLLKHTLTSTTQTTNSQDQRYSNIHIYYAMIRHEMNEKQIAHQLLIELLV